MDFKVTRFDHIVLCVKSVPETIRFYENVVGMESREERPGKWSLHFGQSKISLQDAITAPDIAKATTPGSGNFCVLSDTDVSEWVPHLERFGVSVVAGPGVREGAVGPILSVYFKDPNGNLIEVSNRLEG